MYSDMSMKVLQAIARSYGVKGTLLSVGSDAKTTKGEKVGIKTAILYLMPDDRLCPMARLAGCRESCLVSAGRAERIKTINMARKARTDLFHANRELFVEILRREVLSRQKSAHKLGMDFAVRLNGTSDIDWSTVRGEDGLNVFEAFPGVQFYDYTKRPSVLRKASSIRNWDVTASYSGVVEQYATLITRAATEYGANMAVVFRGKLPGEFRGIPVINGDETDLRFKDERGVIVGLKAKGQAKKDKTGFVQEGV